MGHDAKDSRSTQRREILRLLLDAKGGWVGLTRNNKVRGVVQRAFMSYGASDSTFRHPAAQESYMDNGARGLDSSLGRRPSRLSSTSHV